MEEEAGDPKAYGKVDYRTMSNSDELLQMDHLEIIYSVPHEMKICHSVGKIHGLGLQLKMNRSHHDGSIYADLDPQDVQTYFDEVDEAIASTPMRTMNHIGGYDG